MIRRALMVGLAGAAAGGGAVLAGCGTVNAKQADAGATTCSPSAPFTSVIPLVELSATGLVLQVPRPLPDELTVFFAATTSATDNDANLYVATRSALTQPFGMPGLLTAENTTAVDADPDVSPDLLTLWFASKRGLTQGQRILTATRPSPAADFGTPGVASMVNDTSATTLDAQPFETADGQELWLSSTRAPNVGGFDIWHAERSGAGFGPAIADPELSSAAEDYFPTLSADRLTIYLSSLRTGTGAKGGFDIWRSQRTTVNDGFPAPTPVSELNTANDDFASWLSPDNCRLYGLQNTAAGYQAFVASREP